MRRAGAMCQLHECVAFNSVAADPRENPEWHGCCYKFHNFMMPSLAEIVFNCPLCRGPLIAWETDAGRTTDCPHCLKPLSIPGTEVGIVDKDTFCEPMGLRRILQEVRDSEWESIRR